MIFNLLTWDNRDEELDAEGVKKFGWLKLLFIVEENFFALSSICFDEKEGEILLLIVDEDVKWWWSSYEDIRDIVDGVSLTSRDDADDDDDEAAAAAARKKGWDNAAAIAAWFESTKHSRKKTIISR